MSTTTKRVKISEGCWATGDSDAVIAYEWFCPVCGRQNLCYESPPDNDTRECSECGATFQRDPSWEIVSTGKGKS